MQVNHHGSQCIPGVFLYCFGYKKSKILYQKSTKYAILTLKYQKKILGREQSHPTPPLGAFGASTRLAP